MTPQTGDIYRTRVSGRLVRVQVEARLEVAEHLYGNRWKRRTLFRCVNLASGKRVVKRASQLKALKSLEVV